MAELTRRSFVARSTALAFAPLWQRALHEPCNELRWTDVADWRIEGRAFSDRKAPYDRLPARAEGVVRDAVWHLSRHSAGMLLRFQSTSPELRVRYRLTSNALAKPHMPATGTSGCDLYGHDGERWRWIDVSRPKSRDVEHVYFQGRRAGDGGVNRFQLYLPLFNAVERLELGTAGDHLPTPLPARRRGAIVCYGTSILHGACASRPGMAWPAQLGRRLDREVTNLGFSGNGKMESEVGRFLCELDPAAFVIDCLPNMQPAEVAERTAPLVHQLRKARPTTPILLVEDRTFANAWFHRTRAEAHEQRRRALREAFAALQRDGVHGLHLLGGAALLGDDGEGTTDGSHPNDLGMMRMADAVAGALREVLAE